MRRLFDRPGRRVALLVAAAAAAVLAARDLAPRAFAGDGGGSGGQQHPLGPSRPPLAELNRRLDLLIRSVDQGTITPDEHRKETNELRALLRSAFLPFPNVAFAASFQSVCDAFARTRFSLETARDPTLENIMTEDAVGEARLNLGGVEGVLGNAGLADKYGGPSVQNADARYRAAQRLGRDLEDLRPRVGTGGISQAGLRDALNDAIARLIDLMGGFGPVFGKPFVTWCGDYTEVDNALRVQLGEKSAERLRAAKAAKERIEKCVGDVIDKGSPYRRPFGGAGGGSGATTTTIATTTTTVPAGSTKSCFDTAPVCNGRCPAGQVCVTTVQGPCACVTTTTTTQPKNASFKEGTFRLDEDPNAAPCPAAEGECVIHFFDFKLPAAAHDPTHAFLSPPRPICPGATESEQTALFAPGVSPPPPVLDPPGADERTYRITLTVCGGDAAPPGLTVQIRVDFLL